MTDPLGETTTFAYTPAGQRAQMHLPNGITAVYTYDLLDRLEQIRYQQADTVLAAYTYDLDAAGKRTRVTELDGSTVDWRYDAAARLTQETRIDQQGTVQYAATYTYDAMGNRLSQTVNGQTTTYSYNNLDQCVSAGMATYRYDVRGNLAEVTDGVATTTYTFDAADRLVQVTLPDATQVQYAYDSGRHLVQQTVGTEETNYLWDDLSRFGDVVLETDGSGAIRASYTYGAQDLLAQNRQGTVSYYVRDGQQSTRALTTADGTVTEQYTYDAFGNLLHQQGGTTTPYQYTGQQFDHATGLYYLRSRFYDPVLGRFLSADTAAIDLARPTELNRYLYVSSNPISYYDPTGYGLYDYSAINDAVQENTDHSTEVLGWGIGNIGARANASFIALDAQQIEQEAIAKFRRDYGYEPGRNPNVEGKQVPKGRAGFGYAEYVDIDGNKDAFGAVKVVGLKGTEAGHAQDLQSFYDDYLIPTAESKGIRIVNKPSIVTGSADVPHIEQFLQTEGKKLEGAGRIPAKTTISAGVPYFSICGTCGGALMNKPGRTGNLGEVFTVLNDNPKRRTGMVFRALPQR